MGAVASQITSDCLLNRLFRRKSNKTSKLRVIGKGPVTRKMFPFDVVIMWTNDLSIEIITKFSCALLHIII